MPPHAVIAEAWPPGAWPQIRLSCTRPGCRWPPRVFPNRTSPHVLAYVAARHTDRRPNLIVLPALPRDPWWRRHPRRSA